MLNTFYYIMSIMAQVYAQNLEQYAECQIAIDADAANDNYGAPVEVTACGAQTADECQTAALALTDVTAIKMACLMYVVGCDAVNNPTHALCSYSE